ncbi:methylenetetrahydrofolate reductase C-terminal domain-containing protein, partial [bacterium]|nr:methylenetetrahydrofolate reductase C-terminal domain-containing protein [bacterium]
MLKSIQDGKFTIVVEFTPHSKQDVARMAAVARDLPGLNEKYADKGVVFAGISLTQNPGGNLSYDHLGALGILEEEGFPESLEVCPHITGKDMNTDAIRSLLVSLIDRGVNHILALTGDLSETSKGVFEVDSLGLLQLVNEINIARLRSCKTYEDFTDAPVLFAGGAVSPFKYTPGSLAMQYIKARKKIQQGASFLTCQSGWDAECSEALIRELGGEGVPILGNVLVVTAPVAKYMQTLPGCVVSDEFLKALAHDKESDALVRAGRQLAMFRSLGYAGVDLGKPSEFKKIEEIEKVVDVALETADWREFKNVLHFPVSGSASPKVKAGAGLSRSFHNAVFEPDGALRGVAEMVLSPFEKSYQREGALYHLFNCIEGFGKGVMYECEHCGDCFLPENDFICTMGGCEKGLDNPPCGDADARGYCGNNANRICVGERLYYRLLHHGDLEQFEEVTRPHRKAHLQDTSSVLNYFFHRDHTNHANPLAGSGLIQIAELLHASIPLPGAAMRFIMGLGEEGFAKPNRGRAIIEYLITTQAREGADYIDLNIDALGDPNASETMRHYVGMVHDLADGTPPCIDSSDLRVLQAGLEEWFRLGGKRPPLVNSIPYMDMDKFRPLMEMRGKNAFSAICLLVGTEGPLKSSQEMVDAAREVFKLAKESGFRSEELLFDTVTLGIASDGCMDAMGNIKASHTHHSFNAIRQIRNDPEMKGVHAVLGVSNWVYGATKRRIGHIRAFIAAGQEYGLDAGIVDVSKQFGVQPAAPELVDFVKSYVSLD